MFLASRTSISRISRALVAGAAFAILSGAAQAAPPADLDVFVAQAMKTFGPPGMTVAIVEDGKVAVTKGYGIRSIDKAGAVNEHTVFPIGSETKAFTSAALAILVDEGKLKWSDRVVDKLPGFQMYDPYATEHMTILDLLTHRSGLGLGEGDLMIVPSTTRTRADIVHALRYLKPVTGFRETFAYDNILYIVAGQLVEAVSGQTWEDFVRTHIFAPVGMKDAMTAYDANAANGVALHARTDGPISWRRSATCSCARNGERCGRAGGLDQCERCRHGPLDAGAAGARQTSERRKALQRGTGGECGSPKSSCLRMRFPSRLPRLCPKFQDLCAGMVRGIVSRSHDRPASGAVLGAVAALYLIPEKNVGVAVTINSEDGVCAPCGRVPCPRPLSRIRHARTGYVS